MSISDRLEEEGKLEICKACFSAHVIETKDGVICGTCGTENYTIEIGEKDYFDPEKEETDQIKVKNE